MVLSSRPRHFLPCTPLCLEILLVTRPPPPFLLFFGLCSEHPYSPVLSTPPTHYHSCLFSTLKSRVFFSSAVFFFFSKTSKNGGKKKKKNFQYPQPLPSPRDQHERSAPPAHTQKTKAVRSPQLPPVTPFPKLRNSPFCFCTHTKKTRPLEIVLKHDEKKKKKKTLDPNSPCIKLTKVKNKNDIALRFSRSSPSRTTAD